MASELDMGQRKVLMRTGTSRDKYPKAVYLIRCEKDATGCF
jgi:hypothetical protein